MKTEKDLLMKLIELYEKQESIKIKCKILKKEVNNGKQKSN